MTPTVAPAHTPAPVHLTTTAAPEPAFLAHIHAAERWLGSWWPVLAIGLAALIALWVWITLRRSSAAYRHSRGMASARAVRAVAGRRALAKRARYTRPGLAHPRGSLAHPRRGRDFRRVGVRLGRVGTFRRRWIGMSHEDSLGILGPTRQGKTRRILARVIGGAVGTIIFASTKQDLLLQARRFLAGRIIWVLDLDGILTDDDATWTDTHRAGRWPWSPKVETQRSVRVVRWSPVIGSESGDVALARATAWCGDGQNSGATNGRFFAGAAADVLRCYLHAAALTGASMRQVLAWAADPDDDAPLKVLKTHPGTEPGWAGTLAAQMTGRSRPDVYKQLGRALEMFASGDTLARACPAIGEQFDVDAFLYSGDALFILASEDGINSSAYTSAFATELIERARRLALGMPNGRWEPPIAARLDELTKTCRIPKFPAIVADSGGRGISIGWADHGRSDLVDAWGVQGAHRILNNSTWLMVLQGLNEADFLADLSQLAGDTTIVEPARRGRPAAAPRTVPVLPVNSIKTQGPGTAVVFSANLPVFRALVVDIGADKPTREQMTAPATSSYTVPAAPTWAGQP